MKTPLIVEQHFHGAFGVDFNKAGTDEIAFLSEKLDGIGIGGFFPTLVTDTCENIKHQIEVIKKASLSNKSILGIHLEGVFINPDKRGIHNPELCLPLTAENYKLIEDDFIKIVTLAPELDSGLISYLKDKGVKVQAGHCTGWGNVDGVTHTFNAMSEVVHRGISTALKSMVCDDVYSEIIGDGVHVSEDALKLFFRVKPKDKVILISDSLPITYSSMKETMFAGTKIFYDGISATSEAGTIAGSTKLLPDIIKFLGQKGLFNSEYIENTYNYHNLPFKGIIEWDENFNIVKIMR